MYPRPFEFRVNLLLSLVRLQSLLEEQGYMSLDFLTSVVYADISKQIVFDREKFDTASCNHTFLGELKPTGGTYDPSIFNISHYPY